MANEHNISPYPVHYGPPVQPASIPDGMTSGTATSRIIKEEGALRRQEDPAVLAGRKTTFREVRMLQPMPVLAEKTPVGSEVSIGPLLTGITVLALMRRLRRCP